MDRTPIQKWRECENDNKLLSKEIHDYLAQSHEGVQLAVYEHRWRRYVKEKKQPHYDTIKYRFLYNVVTDDKEIDRLKSVIKQSVKVKQTVKNEANGYGNKGRTVMTGVSYGL